jgi:hypothetical protein
MQWVRRAAMPHEPKDDVRSRIRMDATAVSGWRLRRQVAVMLVACLLTTGTLGCTSMKTIRPNSVPGSPTWGKLQVGDTVIVQIANRERWRFVVQQIDGDAIVAPNGRRFERSDIVRVQRKSFSGPKTAGLIAGIVGAVYVAIGIALASAYNSFLG